jgi:hypothetical protein
VRCHDEYARETLARTTPTSQRRVIEMALAVRENDFSMCAGHLNTVSPHELMG